MTLPVVVTTAGRQPTPPSTLLAQLLAAVAAVRPGYTANLPGSLIEDISSTDVGALAVCDSAITEIINSLTPYGANEFLLLQLGQIYLGSGAAPGLTSNTSVFVVFTGPVRFVVSIGFTVSDGTYQYVVQDGGIIGSGGTSEPLFCLAILTGSWVVPTNTVTQLVTSLPTGITVTCANPTAGTPGGTAETEESWRSRVLQSGLAISQGMTTTLRTYLGQVPGVQQRLVSPMQKTGGWEIVVGGSGDPYEIAYAIFTALFDISTLVGSTLQVTAITQANPGVVTLNLNHGYTTGQVAQIDGIVGMINLNGVSFTATVVDEKRISIGINTSGFPAYVSGGVLTPNLRNITVDINDFPNVYAVPFVNPPQQIVVVAVTWNTTEPNFISQASVAQLANPAIVSYVNSIVVGQPINVYVLQSTFQAAVASILTPNLLTTLDFAVSINGVGVSPSPGTGIIVGDPESYFFTTSDRVTVAQS